MKKDILILVILSVFITLLIFSNQFYSLKLKGFFGRSFYTETGDLEYLVAENQGLKAELAKLENIKEQLPIKPSNRLRAIVYSRYPMNFRNELLLDAGEENGVLSDKAVLFGSVLIGKVKEVFKGSSIVQTVFDEQFQTSVRIGSYGVNALLQGGGLPMVTLIPKEVKLSKGDIIYSASPDFPYGLAIGEVREVGVSGDNLFQEASVEFSYDINSIKTVFISL